MTSVKPSGNQLSLTTCSPFCSSAPIWFRLVCYPSSLYLIADVQPINCVIVSLANKLYIYNNL